MIDTIYYEHDLADHHRVRDVVARYAPERSIACNHYGELFNRSGQDFRLQKQRPALILARKSGKLLYPIPTEFGLGGAHNYYFSHLLNCPFDCRYCFLQGKFASANYVLFVNYEDFMTQIADVCRRHDDPVFLFSGYDCDSLALEPVTGFAEYFVPRITEIENAVLELRTKSTQIRALTRLEAAANCVVAYTLSPHDVATAIEHGAPSLADRLSAIQSLQAAGWPVGIRFDPILWCDEFESVYGQFFSHVLAAVDPRALHSVSLGSFRLPKSYAKKLARLYPADALLASAHEQGNEQWAYEPTVRDQMLAFSRSCLSPPVAADKIFVHDAR